MKNLTSLIVCLILITTTITAQTNDQALMPSPVKTSSVTKSTVTHTTLGCYLKGGTKNELLSKWFESVTVDHLKLHPKFADQLYVSIGMHIEEKGYKVNYDNLGVFNTPVFITTKGYIIKQKVIGNDEYHVVFDNTYLIEE